jgi:hypothetical protein
MQEVQIVGCLQTIPNGVCGYGVFDVHKAVKEALGR